MAKYSMVATKTYETVVPAREIEFVTMGGEKVNSHTLPESRWTTYKGDPYTARNKKDRDSMLATGKWRLT